MFYELKFLELKFTCETSKSGQIIKSVFGFIFFPRVYPTPTQCFKKLDPIRQTGYTFLSAIKFNLQCNTE